MIHMYMQYADNIPFPVKSSLPGCLTSPTPSLGGARILLMGGLNLGVAKTQGSRGVFLKKC